MEENPIFAQRCLLLILTAVSVACATQPGGRVPGPERVENVSIESPSRTREYQLRPDVSESRAALEFGADQVWAALPTAYNVLPIPVDGIDSTRRFISGSVLAHRQFLRRPVSQFVDCGSTIVGPSADSYSVSIRIQTKVDSLTSSTSTLRTWVEATGRSNTGTVRCTSSGEFERLVRDQVKELLRDKN